MRRCCGALALGLLLLSANAGVVNPPLAMWLAIRQGLTQADGRRYFDEAVKDALIPAGANGVHALRGKIVSADSPENPSLITLAMSDGDPAEVTLKIGSGVSIAGVEPGRFILFQGVARALTQEPLMLTFEIDGGGTFVQVEKTPSSK